MRNVLRLGLAAAAIGTAVVTPQSASAACSFTVLQDPVPYTAFAVCPSEGSVRVFPYAPAPGGYVVCYMGNEPVQVWVAGTPLGIAPFDVVQAVLNRTGQNPGQICTPAGL